MRARNARVEVVQPAVENFAAYVDMDFCQRFFKHEYVVECAPNERYELMPRPHNHASFRHGHLQVDTLESGLCSDEYR